MNGLARGLTFDPLGFQRKVDHHNSVLFNNTYQQDDANNADNAKIVAGFKDGLMPSFTGRINDEQMMQILAYIKSLKDAQEMPAGNLQQQAGKVPPGAK